MGRQLRDRQHPAPAGRMSASKSSIRVKRLLPGKGALPSSVQVSVLTDRTTSIRATVRDVQLELVLAVALVILVIFLFLRTLPATVIPAVAVPLSLIGTFGVMYLMGFSLNNLTLMALTISTGFVVDDAIVMIENIARFFVRGGVAASGGSGKASSRLPFPSSFTVSLISGAYSLVVHGRCHRAVVPLICHHLAVAIVISAVVSLTLTPMMCARLLRPSSAPTQPSG
ncbi:MAG: efflux RND transporter permease subunit [Nitrospira sp.]|nr:efflux RND transporter permease subunit [Nitrospira sp.]